jgi:hypothetical protein
LFDEDLSFEFFLILDLSFEEKTVFFGFFFSLRAYWVCIEYEEIGVSIE